MVERLAVDVFGLYFYCSNDLAGTIRMWGIRADRSGFDCKVFEGHVRMVACMQVGKANDTALLSQLCIECLRATAVGALCGAVVFCINGQNAAYLEPSHALCKCLIVLRMLQRREAVICLQCTNVLYPPAPAAGAPAGFGGAE
jgi:hypothetical protein